MGRVLQVFHLSIPARYKRFFIATDTHRAHRHVSPHETQRNRFLFHQFSRNHGFRCVTTGVRERHLIVAFQLFNGVLERNLPLPFLLYCGHRTGNLKSPCFVTFRRQVFRSQKLILSFLSFLRDIEYYRSTLRSKLRSYSDYTLRMTIFRKSVIEHFPGGR